MHSACLRRSCRSGGSTVSPLRVSSAWSGHGHDMSAMCPQANLTACTSSPLTPTAPSSRSTPPASSASCTTPALSKWPIPLVATLRMIACHPRHRPFRHHLSRRHRAHPRRLHLRCRLLPRLPLRRPHRRRRRRRRDRPRRPFRPDHLAQLPGTARPPLSQCAAAVCVAASGCGGAPGSFET